MKRPVVISQHWTAKGGDAKRSNAEALIAQLKQRLGDPQALPTQVTLISAGEVCPLLNPAVVAFYHWLKGHRKVAFISAACTSLHAAIVDFYHHGSDQALVISLELDKTAQQDCLNALGIGNDSDQDGLDVVPGVGLVQLQRLPADHRPDNDTLDDALIVEQCQILSQQPGIGGTPGLIRELYLALNDLPESVFPVSFDISSNWGKSLLRGLDRRLNTNHPNNFWLPSIEDAGHHYLSLKPLLELQLYRNKLDSHSLLLLTLGGGGRVGLLRVGRISKMGKNAGAVATLPPARFELHSLAEDIDGYQTAQALKSQSKSAYYQQIRNTLKYPRSRYRGLQNHYFKWHMDHHFDHQLS